MIYYKDSNVIIRPMIQTDIEQFVDAFAKQGWNKPFELFQHYYSQQEDNERTVIVAEVNSKVAGYVTLLPYTDVGPFVGKSIPEIVDLNVLIKFQKMGIGSKMMDVAESIANKVNDFVSLAVGMHYGYGSAQRMYVKRGFIPDGTGVWYKGKQLEQYAKCDNDDDLTLYFQKQLKESE